ncbi:ribosome-binding factor A [PVC group bacterium (ex Bugula neritina AB1)]|nr:ribosome-binding factor A [PVC group bacterium (ex Bugula neritina AB1)]
MSLRKQRMSHQMQREIGELIQTKVRDSRVGFVTVTSVDVSPDLKNAKVYVTILTSSLKERNKTFRGLKSSSGYIAGQLANRMQLRVVPRLYFLEDKGQLHAFKIHEIMQEI